MAQIPVSALPGGWRTARPRLIAGAVVIATAFGVLSVSGVLGRVENLLPGLGSPSPTFQTAPVGRGNLISTITATGPIGTTTNVPLTFKNGGKLSALKVGVGDHIARGQVLAVEDTSDLQTALDQAEATLAQNQANLAKLEAGATDAQKGVAQASVESARTAAADAQKSIAATRTSADKDVAVAQAGVTAAQATVDANLSTLASARDQEAKTLAADQNAVASARKNRDAVEAQVQANQPVLAQAVQQAKDNRWAAQISRDATCGRSQGGDCQAANATVAASETAVNTAQAQSDKGQRDGAQQVAQAQASLSQAKNQLDIDTSRLDAAVVAARHQVDQAEAGLTSARANRADAQAKATATVQSAEAQADQATGALKSAQASYDQTVAPPSPADLNAAKAQVANARAAVEAARANLATATLTSPIDGTVAAINGAVGQWIAGGTTSANNSSSASSSALFTLVSLDNLQVTAQVNEADISKVKLGDQVSFTVTALPNRTFTGKVLSIQPVGTTSNNVVNFNVTTSIQSSKDTTLYPGMTATLNIVSAERRNALLVPNLALSFPATAIRDGLLGGASAAKGAPTVKTGSPLALRGAPGSGDGAVQRGLVMTLKNGRLVTVPVSLGITDGTSTEILSGLQEGETVVVGASGHTTSARTNGPTTGAFSGPAPGGAIYISKGG